MASRFSQIVDAIETELGDATVTFLKGRLASKTHHEWPAVSWILVGADHTFEHGIGLQTVGDTVRQAILTRTIQVEVQCWGGPDVDDIEVTEQLVHSVISATRKCAQGSVQFLGERWLTQEETADYAQAGEMAILTVSFEVPVMVDEHASSLAELTTIAKQGAETIFEGDSGDITECDYTDPP